MERARSIAVFIGHIISLYLSQPTGSSLRLETGNGGEFPSVGFGKRRAIGTMEKRVGGKLSRENR